MEEIELTCPHCGAQVPVLVGYSLAVAGPSAAPAIAVGVLGMPIRDLGLSARTINGLCNAAARTVGDVVLLGGGGLLRAKNLGRVSILEIQSALRRVSVELPWYPANGSGSMGRPGWFVAA